jgi:hypothetical protein
MEGYCSTGQSPQRAVVSMEEEEEEEEIKSNNGLLNHSGKYLYFHPHSSLDHR